VVAVNGREYSMKGFHMSEQFIVSTSVRFLKQKSFQARTNWETINNLN